MPTINLLPNADVSNSPAWTLSTGSDVYALLDDNDSPSNSSADGSVISATAAGKKCIVGFDDLDYTGLNIDSITPVTAVVLSSIYDRGMDYKIGVRILDGSSSELWAEELTGTLNSSGNYITNTFTARTTDGTDAWVDGDIDDIRMEIHNSTQSGGTLRVTYAYFIITYKEVATPTYPSDGNVILKNGLMELKNGLIII